MNSTLINKIYNPPKNSPLPVCIEVNPPKGTDLEAVFSRLDKIADGISFFNVTDSPLARLRANGLMFASMLKKRYGIEPLVNLSCRDRNTIALQSDIIGANLLGVRSIVALTGDSVSSGDHKDSKPVFEVNSLKLLDIIRKLNEGQDQMGGALSGKTDIVAGVVCNPNCRNPDAELKKLEKKKAAGACYALSQPVFDVEASKAFFDSAAGIGIEMYIGLLPFKSLDALKAIVSVPGITAPQALISKLENMKEEMIADFSFDLCHQIVKENRSSITGAHVVSARTPKLAMTLASQLVKMYN